MSETPKKISTSPYVHKGLRQDNRRGITHYIPRNMDNKPFPLLLLPRKCIRCESINLGVIVEKCTKTQLWVSCLDCQQIMSVGIVKTAKLQVNTRKQWLPDR